MTIQITVLSDAATDHSGKLNLPGTFDTILTSQLPVIHPCSIAARKEVTGLAPGFTEDTIYEFPTLGRGLLNRIWWSRACLRKKVRAEGRMRE